jgi:hypothetical protein
MNAYYSSSLILVLVNAVSPCSIFGTADRAVPTAKDGNYSGRGHLNERRCAVGGGGGGTRRQSMDNSGEDAAAERRTTMLN